MKQKTVTLLPSILNAQIIDKNGIRCGKVDDLVLQRKGDTIYVKAILVGPKAWYGGEHGALATFASRLLRHTPVIAVPWKHVVDIIPFVQLNISAHDAHLESIDRKLAKWIERIPGS